MKTKIISLLLSVTALLFTSCKKDWLDKKPDIAMVVPTTLTDFQALLDNTQNSFNSSNCILGEIGTNDFYLASTAYQTLPLNTRSAYTWSLDVMLSPTGPDWVRPYAQIYSTNVVLYGLKDYKTTQTDQGAFENIKGSALFFRGFAYYDMAQIFAKPFDSKTSGSDPGLPLRTIPNVISQQPRASVTDTYSFIINDLKTSLKLLPLQPKYKTRPSKPAAYGLLARLYLSMSDYPNAYLYADSCLKLYDKLIPYNTFNLASTTPIPKYNDEVIYFNVCSDNSFSSTNAIIDSTLYASYNDNDLRKTIFFKKNSSGDPHLFGRYSASTISLFDGIAVDEIYMIRAEANARIGNTGDAIKDLNTLLVTRYKSGTYQPLNVVNSSQALSIVLSERRKELCFRGLRWSDLRRLNKDPNMAVTLSRKLAGIVYTLKPNDNHYVYPIPQIETNFNDIPQNPR